MFETLFPRQADNAYRGQKPGLWILGAIGVLNGVIGFNSVFFTRKVAMNADAIPLDTFPPAAFQTAMFLFALLGTTRIVMFALSAIVLLRYRALAPIMLAIFLLGEILARAVHVLRPTEALGRAGGSMVILAITGLTVVGLGLSLWERKKIT